jgi:hypothetical protein
MERLGGPPNLGTVNQESTDQSWSLCTMVTGAVIGSPPSPKVHRTMARSTASVIPLPTP